MFDYHLHSSLSFDSVEMPQAMAQAAVKAGLKEICFTDHYDHGFLPEDQHNLFTVADYEKAYGTVKQSGLSIRRGVECSLTTWNQALLDEFLAQYPFDFVIGSVHFADGYDPYVPEYWQGKTMRQGFETYLEQTLKCVQLHRNFDVLGHINYVCKSPNSPTHEPLLYADYRDICDEIMKILAQRGKGMEINTSGVDRAGVFLPGKEFLQRFKELGGEIVTIGSDAHDASRVGQYAKEALEILRDVFGYVCTFEGRKAVFHKL